MKTPSIENHPDFNHRPAFARQNRLIAIEGVIGVGKTSLGRLLSSKWKSPCHFEVFEENPFLTGGFYDNQKGMAFNTEVFFLLSRFRQHRELKETHGLQLIDYLFEKNMIFASLNLDEKDLAVYQSVYKTLLPQIRNPDLVIYLKADPETLLRRIYFRDRQFERSITSQYVEKLIQRYQKFFQTYSDAPVVTIDVSGMDFVSDMEDLRQISSLVESRLSGNVQLPLIGQNESYV